jgi:hypothetical protein
MIRGDHSHPALVPVEPIQAQGAVVVDVIEPENGKAARKCPGSLQIAAHIGFIEMRREC